MGRSIDSFKRRHAEVLGWSTIDDDCIQSDVAESSDAVHSRVSARDILNSLAAHLGEFEREILICLAEGMGAREIAARTNVSHVTVMNYRRRIAAKAVRLGIVP
jgi:DNA-binding NarL/FixJ family response regulator